MIGDIEVDELSTLAAGTKLEICIAGHWIQGSVEYAAVYGLHVGGYYFRAHNDHSVVGLCVGMKVRIPE